jgi:hypothetical protein
MTGCFDIAHGEERITCKLLFNDYKRLVSVIAQLLGIRG